MDEHSRDLRRRIRRAANDARMGDFRAAVRRTDRLRRLRCAACGREPRDEENAQDSWSAADNDLGELHVLCPGCRERAAAAEAGGGKA